MELGNFKGNVLLRMPFKRIVPFNNYSLILAVILFPTLVQDGRRWI